MADFASPCPVEQEKTGAFLHDRRNRPKAARPAGMELLRGYLPLILGLACSLALVALAFQARASWDSHRDWVVPVTAPLLVAGGIAFGSLIARREWNPATPALFIAVALLLVAAWDIWLDADERSDTLRDVLAIASAVLLGLLVVAALAGLAVVEWKRPTRAPAPEA